MSENVKANRGRKEIMMEKLILNYKGRDDWERPVYESNGQVYVDVSPYKERKADIHTKCDNDFYGEPDMPISENLEVEFVPGRDTWN